jgi:flavin-dependent dehydrogenase
VDEIKIIGAGPAGLVAAINLAKTGFAVKVFEKNDDCGMRFHGDFQGFENWSSPTDILRDIEDMNVSIDFWHKSIYQSEFYDYKLNKRVVSFEKPGLYLIRRGAQEDSLDWSLKNQALNLGVEILFKKKMPENEGDIIAVGPRRADGIVRGIVFDTDVELPPSIILDDTLAPKTFAYLLTGNGKGCLGTGLKKNYNRADEYFERTLKTFSKIATFKIDNAQLFTGYFNFFILDSYEKNNKLFIGECAGLQDLLFAFGLRQAITSGFLAAKSIITGESYDSLIKNRFTKQMETSISNRFLFSLLGNRGYQFSLKKGRKIKNPLQQMYKQYNLSLFKRGVLPFARHFLKTTY